MARSNNTLNNQYLKENLIPASQYNLLPHIDDMRDAAKKHAVAHAHLLGLIAARGLSGVFSIHLIHKHFDIPDNRVMVYEVVKSQDKEDFVVSCPRQVRKCDARSLYFQAGKDGSMQAYEYTTEPGADLAEYADFVDAFSRAVVDHGVGNVFALTAMKVNQELLSEFELTSLISTVLVPDISWLPTDANPESSTTTDWVAESDYAKYAAGGPIPGMIQLKCLETKSTSHYNVTCSTTRSGAHYQQNSASGPGMDDMYLNDVLVPKDSKSYAIITQAVALIESY